MKHTQGPWEVRPYEYRKRGQSYTRPAAVIANDKDGTARVWISTEVMGHDLKGSSLANARLIAAAPELLEALTPFAAFACDEPCGCHNCRARTAIAKATGGDHV